MSRTTIYLTLIPFRAREPLKNNIKNTALPSFYRSLQLVSVVAEMDGNRETLRLTNKPIIKGKVIRNKVVSAIKELAKAL